MAILQNLRTEFLQNQTALEDIRQVLSNSQRSSLTLMNMIQVGHAEDAQVNLDSLIFWTIEYYPFNPSNNVFSDLLQSGRMQLLSNDTLRNTIFTWSTELENYRNSFSEYQHFLENHILVYYIEHLALKNIDQYGSLKWNSPSNFVSDYNFILRDRKFENLMDNHLYHANLIEVHFDNLSQIINSILELSKSN